MASHKVKILTAPEVAELYGLSIRKQQKLAEIHDGKTFVRTGKAGRPFRGYKAGEVKKFMRSLKK
jgi:hypothetical protein